MKKRHVSCRPGAHIEAGVKRASKTLRGLESAWVADQQVYVKGGRISEYEVRLKITFLMEE